MKQMTKLENIIMNRSGCNRETANLIANDILQEVEKDLQADVAEVVRCKDCKFWTPMDNGICWHHQGRTDGECEKLWQLHCAERHLTNQDHFCSYGERKE